MKKRRGIFDYELYDSFLLLVSFSSNPKKDLSICTLSILTNLSEFFGISVLLKGIYNRFIIEAVQINEHEYIFNLSEVVFDR